MLTLHTGAKKMQVKNIALLAVMTSLCVGIQLTPRPPNIEFTSLICFLTGFLFGSFFGISVGALTMLLNGFLSPWGFGATNIPFQILGMALIGFVGGAYRKSCSRTGNPSVRWFSLEVSLLAAFLTLFYDLITTVSYVMLFNVNIVITLISGAWFTIVHVVSNTVLFGTALIILVRIAGNVLGEQQWGYQKEVS
jgi:uncharacterized membrane protein